MTWLACLCLVLVAGDLPMITGVEDRPNDAGDGLLVHLRGVDDPEIMFYALHRRLWGDPQSMWTEVRMLPAPLSESTIIDGLDPDYPVDPGVRYEYRLLALTAQGDSISGPAYISAEVAEGEWFNTGVVPVLVACLVFIALIISYFKKAMSGAELYLRPISGIDAIDEAIGRATEMGKPVLYVPGLSTIDDVATIASLTILNRVARKIAEYQTPLRVPNADPIVYTVAEETVKQAYLEANRPDAYDPDSVFFLSWSQFAYVAAVNGIMVREKPATNFYLGMFWAESLILAETGSLSGAIQIAGTDAVTQLPFFITTCDYTLIGEELYAASAYLGREPKQLAAIKGQDAFKAIIILFITLGLVAGIVSILAGEHRLLETIQRIIHARGAG